MDTKRHSYGDFFNEIYMNTGGVAPVINSYANAKDNEAFRLHLECKAKALYNQADKAFDIMEELLLESDFTDKKRLLEILEETKSRLEANLQSAGHAAAELRAASYFNKTAYIEEQLRGIGFYKKLDGLIKNFDAKADELIGNLQDLVQNICKKQSFMLDYTGTKEGFEEK